MERGIVLRIKYLVPKVCCGYVCQYDTYYPIHLKDAIRLICGKEIYDDLWDCMVKLSPNEIPVELDEEPIKIISYKNHEYWVAISSTIFVYNEVTDKLKILIEEK